MFFPATDYQLWPLRTLHRKIYEITILWTRLCDAKSRGKIKIIQIYLRTLSDNYQHD
jgi:hypothetical protein